MKREEFLNSKQITIAPFALFTAILSVSTAAIFIRFAQETIPSLTIAAYRMVIASLILFPFTIKKTLKEWKVLNPKSIGLVFLSSILLALHFGSWISSLEYTKVISSVVLVTTTPIWVAVISPWLLKEKVPKRFLLGLMIAFLGILLLNFSGYSSQGGFEFRDVIGNQPQVILGNLLALVGAFCAAGYVIVGRTLRKQLSTESYVLSVYSITGLLLVMLVVLTNGQIVITDISGLKWLLLIAFIPQVIGHSLLNWSLGLLPAYSVAISLLGEPIGSSMLAIVFLKEIPSLIEIISSLVILLGIIIAVTKSKKINKMTHENVQE
ncbi:MAG: DMT family transporter [Pelolinea sp.]|nr:DMT family transporter [Pelolinea sp.]